jgi:hypothetical protein
MLFSMKFALAMKVQYFAFLSPASPSFFHKTFAFMAARGLLLLCARMI